MFPNVCSMSASKEIFPPARAVHSTISDARVSRGSADIAQLDRSEVTLLRALREESRESGLLASNRILVSNAAYVLNPTSQMGRPTRKSVIRHARDEVDSDECVVREGSYTILCRVLNQGSSGYRFRADQLPAVKGYDGSQPYYLPYDRVVKAVKALGADPFQ